MNTGKQICEVLKSIRQQIADTYGLVYEPIECNHEGDCKGTCFRCDEELKDLQHQLDAKGISQIKINERIEHEMYRLTEGMTAIEYVEPLEGDIMLPSPKKKTRERILYKRCAVAGIGFHNIDEVWDQLYVGTEIALVRDKKNEYDQNAVAVALTDDYDGNPVFFDFNFILGYIPRSENEYLARMLDIGWSDIFECEIDELHEDGPYNDRIHISIYIKSKKDVERKHSTRLRTLF